MNDLLVAGIVVLAPACALLSVWWRPASLRPAMVWSLWAEKDGSVIGYMCRTDFEYELGAASGGNAVYPSMADIKARRSCAAACGIVEVEVRFRRLVEPGSRECDE
jgi:hypothetical protein